MTCIVGLIDKKNKKVIIGADSAGVAGLSITKRKDPKVFKVGEFVIGCTSSFRMIQLLRFSFKPPEVKTKDVYSYMCTDFVNAVRECFKAGGYLQKHTEGDEKGGCFLVGYKDKLYSIESDFQVGESFVPFHSVGCGSEFALSAMYVNSKRKLKPNEVILSALDSAAFFSAGVCRPFLTLST